MPENIIQIDQNLLETRLDRLVTQKVTELLKAMLDAEADEIAGAARYERSGGRKAYRAGHYECRITAKAGTLELKVPKPEGALFESAVVFRLTGDDTQIYLTKDSFASSARITPAFVRIPAPLVLKRPPPSPTACCASPARPARSARACGCPRPGWSRCCGCLGPSAAGSIARCRTRP